MEWIIVAVLAYGAIMFFGKLQDGMDRRRGEMYEEGRQRKARS